MMGFMRTLALTGGFALSGVGAATAATIGLDLEDEPDFVSQFVGGGFDLDGSTGEGILTLTGPVLELLLVEGGGAGGTDVIAPVANGMITIQACITVTGLLCESELSEFGNEVSSGRIAIEGEVVFEDVPNGIDIDWTSGNLLEGEIAGFGFESNGSDGALGDGTDATFEFLWDYTGGEAQELFAGVGLSIVDTASSATDVGMMFNGTSDLFIEDFTVSAIGTRIDTGVARIPLPGGLPLLLGALGGLAIVRRARRKA